MNSKRQKNFAYVLAIVLLLIGVLGYAAYPEKKPEPPVRVMLKNIAGNVLLDHKQHADTSGSGYGVPCMDCHHDMDNAKAKPQSCGECHKADGEDGPKRSEVFHQLCKGCHEEGGAGPTKCAGCHMM